MAFDFQKSFVIRMFPMRERDEEKKKQKLWIKKLSTTTCGVCDREIRKTK